MEIKRSNFLSCWVVCWTVCYLGSQRPFVWWWHETGPPEDGHNLKHSLSPFSLHPTHPHERAVILHNESIIIYLLLFSAAEGRGGGSTVVTFDVDVKYVCLTCVGWPGVLSPAPRDVSPMCDLQCEYPYRQTAQIVLYSSKIFFHRTSPNKSAKPICLPLSTDNVIWGCLATVPSCLPASVWVISALHTGDPKSAPPSWSQLLSHHVQESNCRWQHYGRQRRQQAAHELMLLKYAESLLCQHTIP